jgi:hypothetical protein
VYSAATTGSADRQSAHRDAEELRGAHTGPLTADGPPPLTAAVSLPAAAQTPLCTLDDTQCLHDSVRSVDNLSRRYASAAAANAAAASSFPIPATHFPPRPSRDHTFSVFGVSPRK